MSNKNSISWRASEYKHYEKNIGWYITVISVLLLIVGFFVIIQSDYFAGITLGIIGFIFLFFGKQKPEMVENQLTTKAVHHGYLNIPYKQIKHFWVVNRPNHKTVNFETSAFLNKIMILELEDQDADEIREFLLNFLPEHEVTEPHLTQKVSHWMKF